VYYTYEQRVAYKKAQTQKAKAKGRRYELQRIGGKSIVITCPGIPTFAQKAKCVEYIDSAVKKAQGLSEFEADRTQVNVFVAAIKALRETLI